MNSQSFARTVVTSVAIVVAAVYPGVAAEPTTTRHLTVSTSVPAEPVVPGARVSLVVEVAPKPSMHVYAPGQKDLIPVSLTLAASDAITAERAQFPAAEKLEVKDLGETHLVYSKPFQIVQDVTVAANPAVAARLKKQGSVTLKGTFKYQACDNTICYAPVTVPVSWTLALHADGAAAKKKP